MLQLLSNLPHQDQKLYGFVVRACTAALVLGLFVGMVSLNSNKADGADNWRATEIPARPDAASDFAVVTGNSRWFREKAAINPAQAAEEARKAIEGQPESLKLIGIIERAGIRYALFIPVDPTAGRAATPYTVGDTLVGDWKVKEITSGGLTVTAQREGEEPQTRELLLYRTKK